MSKSLNYYDNALVSYLDGTPHHFTAGQDFNTEDQIKLFEHLLPSQAMEMVKTSGLPIVLLDYDSVFLAAVRDIPEGSALCVNLFHLRPFTRLETQSEASQTMWCEIMVHEFKHVEQIERGDLIFCQKRGVAFWKGQEYDLTVERSLEEYMNLPWEVEAYTAGAEYLVENGHYRTTDEVWEVLKARAA